MTNFDPKKLEEFLNKNPGLTSAKVSRLLKGVPAEPTEAAPLEHAPAMSKAKPFFTSGDIVLINRPEGKQEYRIVSTENGIVTVISLGDASGHRSKESETFAEEELKKMVEGGQGEKEERPSYKPLSDLFSNFNSKVGYNTSAVLTWKRKWLDSGEVDTFRNNYKNIDISDEQLEDAKKAFAIYAEDLEKDETSPLGMRGDLHRTIVGNLCLAARILTGVHHPVANDIENLVTNFKNHNIHMAEIALRIREEIDKGKKELAALRSPQSPVATEEKKMIRADARDLWPGYITYDAKRGWTFQGKTLPIHEWSKANDNIRPIFDEYRKFMLSGNQGEMQRKWDVFGEVIDAKNRITKALHEATGRTEALDDAIHEAAELANLIEEKKKEWEKVKEEDKKNQESETRIAKIKEDFEKKKKVFEEQVRVKSAVNTWDITAESAAYFKRLVRDIKKLEEAIEKMLTEKNVDVEITHTYATYVLQIQELQTWLDRTKGKRGMVLRPGTLRPTSIEAARKEKERVALLEEHRRMYAERPENYRNLFQHKQFASGDPAKEVVKLVLEENGESFEPNDGKKEEADQNSSLFQYRATYSPAKEEEERADKKWPEDERTDEQKLEDQEHLRSAGFETLTNVLDSKEGAGMTYQAERDLPEMASGKSEQEYADEAGIEANETEASTHRPESSRTQEREGKLKWASDLIRTRLNSIKGIKRMSGIPPWVWLSAAISVGVIYSAATAPKSGEKTSTVATAPDNATKKGFSTMDYSNWRSYIDFMVPNEKLAPGIETILKNESQQAIETYTGSKKAAGIEAVRISDPNINILELSEKERMGAHDLIDAAEHMANGALAAASERVKQGHAPYSFQYNPEKMFGVKVTNGVSVANYIKKVRDAVLELNAG